MSLQTNVTKVLDLLGDTLENLATRSFTQSSVIGQIPAILAVTGLQGSGKSTWASAIVQQLRDQYGLSAIQVSLDDFYLTHAELIELREENPGNKLLRTRGQPGTHDENLAAQFFRHLQQRQQQLRVPVFDKSLNKGEGDRLPKSQWPSVPEHVDVVVFEGWCVGFQPLSIQEITKKRQEALHLMEETTSDKRGTLTLPTHPLEHLLQINLNLARYCSAFMGPQHIDFLIHLDTDDLANVYDWRLEQEHALIQMKGTGMSDDEVISFIKGYMPTYELYLENLRNGLFRDGVEFNRKQHIQVLLGRKRDIVAIDQVQQKVL